MCGTCRPIKTNINVDCLNYAKFNHLINVLDESIEENKQVLEVVECERRKLHTLFKK